MHKQHRGVVPNQPEIARSHRHGQKEHHFDNSNSQELLSTVFQPSSATSQWIRYVKSQAAGLDNGPSHIPRIVLLGHEVNLRSDQFVSRVDGGQGWLAARMSRPAEACLILQCS
uniref:Uncharacterized protein n=1 Tax=Fusarium oxysporum (strain Fo5176) TaxID=660025 RepID=A0A0D2XQQ6_FUSOF